MSNLCALTPQVLRYWEQEFTQLRPMKRPGNRRDYQLHEVKLMRQIRQLLYGEEFAIVGGRHTLQALLFAAADESLNATRTLDQHPQSAGVNRLMAIFVRL